MKTTTQALLKQVRQAVKLQLQAEFRYAAVDPDGKCFLYYDLPVHTETNGWMPSKKNGQFYSTTFNVEIPDGVRWQDLFLDLTCPAPITDEFLDQAGFAPIHKRATWILSGRRWMKYVRTDMAIIVTFGDFYCRRDQCDVFVWLMTYANGQYHQVELPYVKTTEMLENLWGTLSSDPLIGADNDE